MMCSIRRIIITVALLIGLAFLGYKLNQGINKRNVQSYGDLIQINASVVTGKELASFAGLDFGRDIDTIIDDVYVLGLVHYSGPGRVTVTFELKGANFPFRRRNITVCWTGVLDTGLFICKIGLEESTLPSLKSLKFESVITKCQGKGTGGRLDD